MSLIIRPVAERDKSVWVALFAAYREFYGEPNVPEIVEKAWEMVTAGGENASFVAERDGAVVGMTTWREFADPYSASRGAFLDDLFVAPDARGEGAGEALIAAVAEAARERGLTVVRWITAPDNLTARRLYDRVAVAQPWVTYDLDPNASS